MISISEIEAKARVATPGSWFSVGSDRFVPQWTILVPGVPSEECTVIAEGIVRLPNAEHIAACSPDVILAICEDYRAMREALERVERCDYRECGEHLDRARTTIEGLKVRS